MNVEDIQMRLVELGYDPGPVDGQIGKKTKTAIMEFQADHGLVPDGLVGSKTLAKLSPASPQNGAQRTSVNGRQLIRQREGERFTAYQDSIGVWTIGVGHTAAAGLPHPVKGMTITPQQSDAILSDDLKEFEDVVHAAIKVPMTQNEFDALVSLALNIGGGNFSKSTLVKKINSLNKAEAADQFLVWNKAGGKVLAGLTTRRKSERKQFLTP